LGELIQPHFRHQITALLKRERIHMENSEQEIMVRPAATANRLEPSGGRHESGARELSGEVEKISATVEQERRDVELAERLAVVEHELAEMKAAASPVAANSMRRTVPAATSEMLAKHGIGEGPVDVRALDTALAGLSLEQRIAVKTQLLRAGAIA
jgi:hypothetical protein